MNMRKDDIERVLMAAGPREKPPADIEHALRENLRQEWRAVVAERGIRRRRIAYAFAAGIAAAAIGAWFAMPDLAAPGQPIGTVVQVSGELRVKPGRFARWQDAVGGRSVSTGEILATGPSGRGALALAGGISARLDQATQVRLEATDRLVINHGAVYVDAGADSASMAPLEIVTPAGSVRHRGTQYEVRILRFGVRLRVREGRVEWRSGAGSAAGVAGEELTIANDGSVRRGSVPLHGEAWDWAVAVAPTIYIEGLSLAGFLDWAARELGCRIEFSSTEVAQQAGSVILHGSIAELAPAQALTAVLATSRMQATVQDGRILVTGRDAQARHN